ncbi:MAG: hydrogenase maturation nickel metallochaperone HypA [Candidatus Heimdallarchaeota archaeon]
MHELSLADSILSTALEVAKQHNAMAIKQVTVEIGSFALVQLDQLRFCINILTEKTIAAHAKFKLLQTPGELQCAECGFQGAVADIAEDSFGMNLFSCPQCSSVSTQIISGREVIVRSVDLALDQNG